MNVPTLPLTTALKPIKRFAKILQDLFNVTVSPAMSEMAMDVKVLNYIMHADCYVVYFMVEKEKKLSYYYLTVL